MRWRTDHKPHCKVMSTNHIYMPTCCSPASSHQLYCCLVLLLRNVVILHWVNCKKVKVKAHTLDIAPLGEPPPQKRSSMERVLKGFHSFTCTPTRSSAIRMSHTCLCLSSCSRYSFTDFGGMEGWVGLSGWLRSETVYLPEGSHASHC